MTGISVANPIQGVVVDDARCDFVGATLFDELGSAPIFPPGEIIDVNVQPTTLVVKVPDDGQPNDWRVRIVNLTGQPWGSAINRPLFFVANIPFSVGNADGTADFTPFPGFSDCFEIDSLGLNQNLITESMAADNIFMPGESWEFLVTNFLAGGVGGWLPPSFRSLGHSVGAGGALGLSTASIVAGIPIPEPASVSMLVVAGGLLLRRRR
jgi:hypothetical protein